MRYSKSIKRLFGQSKLKDTILDIENIAILLC